MNYEGDDNKSAVIRNCLLLATTVLTLVVVATFLFKRLSDHQERSHLDRIFENCVTIGWMLQRDWELDFETTHYFIKNCTNAAEGEDDAY